MDKEGERIRIGKKIAELRKEAGMSQVALAGATGLRASNIAAIEKGRYSTGLDILSRIGDSIGYRIDYVRKPE